MVTIVEDPEYAARRLRQELQGQMSLIETEAQMQESLDRLDRLQLKRRVLQQLRSVCAARGQPPVFNARVVRLAVRSIQMTGAQGTDFTEPVLDLVEQHRHAGRLFLVLDDFYAFRGLCLQATTLLGLPHVPSPVQPAQVKRALRFDCRERVFKPLPLSAFPSGVDAVVLL